MKFLSFLTLTAILSISSCSMMNKDKGCCATKSAAACSTEDCKKASCDKDKKCADGSCDKTKKNCEEASCHKKS